MGEDIYILPHERFFKKRRAKQKHAHWLFNAFKVPMCVCVSHISEVDCMLADSPLTIYDKLIKTIYTHCWL